MNQLQRLIPITVFAAIASLAYSAYVVFTGSMIVYQETAMSEVGEVFGEACLWLFGLIYGRTLLKLAIGKGAVSQRFVPEFAIEPTMSATKKLLGWMNRTHVLIGWLTIAALAAHLIMVGFPMEIWFFPAVAALVIWQGLFGMFLRFKFKAKRLKKFAYLVHAQLFTGVLIGIFSYAGHLLIGD